MVKFKEGMYEIIRGEYKGRIGHLEANLSGEKIGNCMFYPIEGQYPYRVCLALNDVRKINN
jgi:hypothetical protein